MLINLELILGFISIVGAFKKGLSSSSSSADDDNDHYYHCYVTEG